MGIPKVGGEIPGCRSYHENDVYAFNAYISKFLCKNDFVTRRIFLETLIGGFLKKPSGAYPIDGKIEALKNPQHEMNYLFYYCMEQMKRMGLVKSIEGESPERTYLKTSRLSALCARIMEYDMPFVEGLVKELTNIETEIQRDKSYNEIAALLRTLSGRRINRYHTSLSNDTITNLIDLGVINISLTNMLSLTSIGKVLLV